MHRAGVVHRDYYLYHLLVDEKQLRRGVVALSLIDLHRAQLRRRIPPRWLVRDLGGAAVLVPRPAGHAPRPVFVRAYEGRPLRVALKENGGFWSRVQRRAVALYRKGQRKGLVADRFTPGAFDD